jgi:Ca2+-binding RTX toxin-like protein
MLRTVSGEAYVPLADFQVSADTRETQHQLVFAKLGDGGFVAAWRDGRFGTDSLRMQRFDLNGSKVGAEIVLPGHSGPLLASTPSGGVLLTWNAQNPYPSSFDVHGRFYDSDLNALGSEFTINTRTDGFQAGVGVTALAEGGYVALWNQLYDNPPGYGHAQILDAFGNKIGGEIRVSEGARNDGAAYALTALAGGGFVATWGGSEIYDQYGNTNAGLRAQIFDRAGTKVGSAFSLNTITAGNQSNVTLAGLPSGGFVAAWTDDGTQQALQPANGNQGVWVQLFDSLGQKVGAAIHLESAADAVHWTPTIAVTATGFVVTWPESTHIYAGQNELRVQRFDFAGNKVGGEFGVGVPLATHLDPTSLVLESGAILVGWTHRAPTGFDSDDVRAKLLFPAQHGTDAADSFAGAGGGDYYFGRAGDDVLSGGADFDGLSGGDGDDHLNGGAGNDILDGGAGADTMTGGSGNDAYTVDHLGDAVIESADEGIDTVETSLTEYAAPAAVENVTGTLGAGATQILRGNALSNNLIGGDADNVFHIGSAGHDVVSGKGGRDTLYIDWSDSTSPVTGSIVSSPLEDTPGAIYKDGTGRSVTYTSVETVTLTTGSGNDTIGTPGSNVITGPSSTHLSTGAGDDYAYLNSTLDSFDGGSGIDGVYINNIAFTVDRFEWRVPSNLFISPAGTPQLANIEYILQGYTSDGNDVVETGALAFSERISTNGGNDEIIVYNGRDTVDGGPGDDLLVIDWRLADENIILNSNPYLSWGGTRSLRGFTSAGEERSVNFVNIERLEVFGGSGDDMLRSGTLPDKLHGGGGDDTLHAFDGDDILTGGSGNDFLFGGTGADSMAGGTGNDFYSVDSFSDQVLEAAEEGIDEVRTPLGSKSDFAQLYILPANVENLTGTAATGQGVQDNALNNVIALGAGGDLAVMDAGGDDHVSGGGGNDYFYWGAAFNNADRADGGAGTDTLGLLGTYRIVFEADDLANIEKLALYSSGNPAAPNGYNLTMHDANLAGGQTMTVIAQSLSAIEVLAFNGAAELDGKFNIRGGKGADTITGGAGNDTIWGNLGADVLRGGKGDDLFDYNAVAESKFDAADTILDFARGDRINLGRIDADGNAANGDTKFSYLGDGAFTGAAGELRVSQHPQHSRTWVVEADENGDRVADLTIYLVGPPGFLPQAGDFIL